MSTVPLAIHVTVGDSAMSFEEAVTKSSKEEGFRATVYAMNSLLINKGIYTKEEFEILFVEWVTKHANLTQPVVTSQLIRATS